MKAIRRLVTGALLGLGLAFGAGVQPAAAQPVAPVVETAEEARDIYIIIIDHGDHIDIIIIEVA